MRIAIWGVDAGLSSAIQQQLQAAGHSVIQSSPEINSDVAILPAQPDRLMQVTSAFAGRVVLLSSLNVYAAMAQAQKKSSGDPTTSMLPETALLRSDDGTETAAETALQASANAWVILRLPQLYGQGMPRLFSGYLSQMDAKRPAILLEPGKANWRCTHGFVTDVARAIALAATHPKADRQIYNLGERETPTVGERLHLLARAAGFKGKILVVPARLAPEHLRDSGIDFRNDVILDTGRIRRELSYADTTPEKQLWQETVSWERAELPPLVLTEQQTTAEDEVLRKFGLLSRK